MIKTTHFFRTVVKYLQCPRLFVDDSGVSVEDFIINEYCKHIIGSYGNKEGLKRRLTKSGVKEEILFQFDSV